MIDIVDDPGWLVIRTTKQVFCCCRNMLQWTRYW